MTNEIPSKKSASNQPKKATANQKRQSKIIENGTFDVESEKGIQISTQKIGELEDAIQNIGNAKGFDDLCLSFLNKQLNTGEINFYNTIRTRSLSAEEKAGLSSKLNQGPLDSEAVTNLMMMLQRKDKDRVESFVQDTEQLLYQFSATHTLLKICIPLGIDKSFRKFFPNIKNMKPELLKSDVIAIAPNLIEVIGKGDLVSIVMSAAKVVVDKIHKDLKSEAYLGAIKQCVLDQLNPDNIFHGGLTTEKIAQAYNRIDQTELPYDRRIDLYQVICQLLKNPPGSQGTLHDKLEEAGLLSYARVHAHYMELRLSLIKCCGI